MKTVLLSIIQIVTAQICCAQITNSIPLWQNTYGDTAADYAFSSIATSNGGFVLAGQSLLGDSLGDIYVVKTDSIGVLVWERRINRPLQQSAAKVIETSDGGYVVAGWTTEYSPPTQDILVVKLDFAGDIVWSFTDSTPWLQDRGELLVETVIGDIIVYRHEILSGSNGGEFISLDYLTSQGVHYFSRSIDGNPGESQILSAMEYTSNHEIVATGGYGVNSTSRRAVLMGFTPYDFSVFWFQYVDTVSMRQVYDIVHVSDSTFVICGIKHVEAANQPVNLNGFVMKISNSGEVYWENDSFGAPSNSFPDEFYAACGTRDGGFVMTGFTYSYASENQSNVFVARVDSCGNSLWYRGVATGGEIDGGFGIAETADQNLVIGGVTRSIGQGLDDYYLLKMCGGATPTNLVIGVLADSVRLTWQSCCAPHYRIYTASEIDSVFQLFWSTRDSTILLPSNGIENRFFTITANTIP